MPIIIPVGGSGGAKLDITAYSAVGSLPASEAAGALAVITSTALGDVYVSADQPSSPSSGDVWVWIGGDSLAPIALTDLFTIHPRAVYQYNGSAWVLLESYVYTGSAWQEVTLFLYEDGTFFIVSAGMTKTIGDTVTLNSTYIYCADGSGRGEYGRLRVYFSDVVDLTDVDIVTMKYDWTTSGGSNPYFRLEIGTNKTGSVVAYTQSSSQGTNKTTSVNVASLSGLYYIGFYGVMPPNSDSDHPGTFVNIKQCYLTNS